MKRLRILMVDDHAILRESLRLLICSQADMDIIGEASEANHAVMQFNCLQPDLMLLDLSIPGGGGGRVLQQLGVEVSHRTLVLTMHAEQSTLQAMLALGANGYVVKTSPPAVLLQAIRLVGRGDKYIDPQLEKEFLRGKTKSVSSNLSEREKQILKLLAHGYSHSQIADTLFLSQKTIETYRTRIGRKLGLRDRADLMNYVLATGLLEDSNPIEPLPK